MAELNYARIREVVGNGDATLLLIKIIHLCNKDKGGNIVDGVRYSYGDTPRWAELTGITKHQAKRQLDHLADLHMIEKLMAWAGVGAGRRYVLHVRPTDRARAISHGGVVQDCADPQGDFALPGSADLHSPYIEPIDLPIDHQKTNLSGPSPASPPTASSAGGKISEENSNPEEQVMQPKIEKGKNSVKDLLKETYKKKILKPDSSKARVDTWINAMIEWDAANGKTKLQAPLSGQEVGFLTNFATDIQAMGLDPLEAITYGVTKWSYVRMRYIDAYPHKKQPPVNPDQFFLWTMRETIGNQLHSSKTAKKQEAVASSVPSTQLTAISAPASASVAPPKKQIASPETAAAIKAKSMAALAAKKAGL